MKKPQLVFKKIVLKPVTQKPVFLCTNSSLGFVSKRMSLPDIVQKVFGFDGERETFLVIVKFRGRLQQLKIKAVHVNATKIPFLKLPLSLSVNEMQRSVSKHRFFSTNLARRAFPALWAV